MRAILLILLINFTLNAQDALEIKKHLKGKTVFDICNDGENLWIATHGDGVYKYSPKKNKWNNYSTQNDELQINLFYSVAANKKYVWAGSTDGLFIFDKQRGKWSKRKFGKGGQLSNWIRSLEYDPFIDAVWIGRFQYLTKYDVKRRRFTDYDLTIKKDEKSNTIKVIEVDGDSLVWFGTENGLHKYNKKKDIDEKGSILYYDNRLNYFNGEGQEVSIASILFEQGFIWIGLDEFITRENKNYNVGGLYKFDRRNEWTRFDTRNGMKGNGVFDIELIGNYLWVSQYQFIASTKEGYGRGLVLVNRITEEVSPIVDNQIPENIYKIHFFGNSVWLGTGEGLVEIDLSNNFVEHFKSKK
ncbi:MAG: hypothetical protein KJ799_04240 [Bacteroidetes bacterium]|nr:hypothetical protein [Bacteroidota bacterium]MBU2505917.1 hypothetical protein [Bacteroidota bacterium]